MSSGVKKRLSATVWIGNFGSFATEFQVLKFAQQIGNVEKFDFMYHDNTSTAGGGIDGRTPRGYAFVTYDNYAVADEAIRKLNGQTISGRTVRVQPATSPSSNRPTTAGTMPGVPKSLAMSIKPSGSSSGMSKEDKIRAMEMKLKALEREGSEGSGSEFKVVIPSSSSSNNKSETKMKTAVSSRPAAAASKPYHRPQHHQSKR